MAERKLQTYELSHFDRLLKVPAYKEHVEMFFKLSPKIGKGVGLEVSPLFQPLMDKDSYKVDFCDYLSYEELLDREKSHPTRIEYNLEVQPLDFVWTPGKRLAEVVPKVAGQPKKYDYIVSSHVLEHVPDFLGYIESMDEVLEDDGVIAFFLPNPLGSPEVFRPQSSIGDVLEAYIKCTNKPSFSNIYDYYRMSVDAATPFKEGTLGDYGRSHSVDTAVRDGLGGSVNYIDAHCWVFTPESFKEMIDELCELGIFKYSVAKIVESDPTPYGRGFEYCVMLERSATRKEESEATTNLRNARKAALEDSLSENNFSSSMKQGYESIIQTKDKEISHGVKAFHEAVAVQEQMKAEITGLKEMLKKRDGKANGGIAGFIKPLFKKG